MSEGRNIKLTLLATFLTQQRLTTIASQRETLCSCLFDHVAGCEGDLAAAQCLKLQLDDLFDAFFSQGHELRQF